MRRHCPAGRGSGFRVVLGSSSPFRSIAWLLLRPAGLRPGSHPARPLPALRHRRGRPTTRRSLAGRPLPRGQLANTALDAVRRRVQHTTLGHRGHKGDPLYRIRRRRLTVFYDHRMASGVPELERLGRTISRWETLILRWHRTRLTNAATEGNLIVKNVKRLGFGFRNFDNYRLRLLLRCGAPWQHRAVAAIRPRHPRISAYKPVTHRYRCRDSDDLVQCHVH